MPDPATASAAMLQLVCLAEASMKDRSFQTNLAPAASRTLSTHGLGGAPDTPSLATAVVTKCTDLGPLNGASLERLNT